MRASPQTTLTNGFFVALFERVDADVVAAPAAAEIRGEKRKATLWSEEKEVEQKDTISETHVSKKKTRNKKKKKQSQKIGDQ